MPITANTESPDSTSNFVLILSRCHFVLRLYAVIPILRHEQRKTWLRRKQTRQCIIGVILKIGTVRNLFALMKVFIFQRAWPSSFLFDVSNCQRSFMVGLIGTGFVIFLSVQYIIVESLLKQWANNTSFQQSHSYSSPFINGIKSNFNFSINLFILKRFGYPNDYYFKHMDYRQAAIPLLVAQRTGKYSITPQAQKIISSIKTPIAIISVAGLYRTGKSYLLNRMLLNRSDGFGVGSTINACTKGLWMWGSPIKTRTEDGQPLTLLIIDTEGLGATDEDDTHDNKIFSLAILLSTCFIYNSTGSIDQTAIQSLNLVLNLSETIYQQSSNSKMDTKELPSFVWVVRDFSLQLIDSKGNHITSKQYLENALALQKNTGKDAEEKNKVRKFITQCFPMRDCCTMIRPCSGDIELRQLDRLPLENLRPEFVEQVMTLRKRIMGRLQPKRINNNIVDGDTYFKIMKTYVDAINNGAVPNIQTAWEYICAEKSQALLNEAEEMFSRGIKDEVQYRLPCLNSQIRNIVDNIKRNALAHFLKGVWGQRTEDTRLELENRLRSKEQSVYSQNQKQSISSAQNIVSKEYQSINKKLKSGLYNNFSQFQHEVKSFYAYLMEHHRKFQSCQMVYMQFINKKILEGSQFFFQTLEQELNVLRQTKAEIQMKGQRQNEELKSVYNRHKFQTDSLISTLEKQKVENEFKLQQLRTQVASLEFQREQGNIEKNHKIDLLTIQIENLSSELKIKQLALQSKVIEGMREDCLKTAEWEKEKALDRQQAKFSKERIEALERKQKQMEAQLLSVKNELESRIKEMTVRGEDKTKSFTQELAEKSDKLFEATGLIKKLQEDLKVLEDTSDSKQRKLRSEILDLQTSLQGFKNNDVVEKNRLMTNNMNQKRQILQSLDQERQRVRVLEIQLRQAHQHIKHNKVSYEKDQAIHTQKIQFQEIQLKQLKSKYNQLQVTHQNALSNCENASRQKLTEIQNSIMFDLKSSHERQMKELEAEWESKIRYTRNEVQNYKRRKEELELSLQLQTKKYEDREYEYKESIRQLEEVCQRIQAEKLNTEQGTAHFKREIEIHYETKIKRLEHELETIRDESRTELNEAHEQSEVTVRQLKSYYDLERERLDRKIQEQKQKADKKVKKTADQYEQRLTQERIQFEEQLASCKNSMNQLEQSYKQKISNLQYEFDVAAQKSANELTEWKIQFERQSSLNQQQLDYANKRVETLLRDKQITQQKFEEKVNEIRAQLQEQMRQSVQKINEEKLLLDQKYQKIKLSLRDSEQTIHRMNIDFEKERTLMKSKESSLEARLAEIEEKSRLRLKLKEEQLQKAIETHDIQKHTLLSETERLKFEYSKLDDEKAKMKSIYQAEKTLLTNKLTFTEQQSKRYKNQCDDIIVKFETTVKHLTKERDKQNNEKNLTINEVVMSMKSQSEREIEALKSNHAKIVRDLDDKIQRLQTEKKNKSDKMMQMQVRLAGQDNLVENDKKSRIEIDKIKREYESRINELEGKVAELRKQNLYFENMSSGMKKNTTDYDDRGEVSALKKTANLHIGSALSNKGIPSSNIQYQARESEPRKSKLSNVSPAVSGTSLLGNIGNVSNISNLSNFSQASKKSTYPKDKLIDLGEFGSPFSNKHR